MRTGLAAGGVFIIGERVEAKYNNDDNDDSGQYYAGSIMKVNQDGTYDVRYDGGDPANCRGGTGADECDTGTSIPEDNIQAAPAPASTTN